jgi:hypothetical protein
MIIWILGLLDLAAGGLLLLARFGIAGSLTFYIGLFVIIKALLFFDKISSILDIVGGCVLILMALYGLEIYNFLLWLFVLWFIQKGIFSFAR